MIKRVIASPSRGNLPHHHDRQTPGRGSVGETDPRPEERLLSLRAAGILGASVLVALFAGMLTYLAAGGLARGGWGADTASAVIAVVVAFAGTVRFLNAIVA